MLTFTQAVKRVIEKGITIEGRAQRSEFWWTYPIVALGVPILSRVSLALGSYGSLICLMISVVAFIFLCCVMGRRLHDRNLSAWWMLLLALPTVGLVILLVLCALPGTMGPNRFGEDPLGQDPNRASQGNNFNNYQPFQDGPYHKNDFPFDPANSDQEKAAEDFTRKIHGNYKDQGKR